MPTLYSNACFIAIDCTAWHAHTCCASHALRAARAALFCATGAGGALRIRSESPHHRPDVVHVVRRQCLPSARSMRGQCASAQIVRLRKLQSPSLHGRTLHPAPPRDTGTAYPLHGPRMMNLQSTAAARRGKQECQSPCTPLHACSHHALVHARPCIAPSRRDKGNCLAPAWHCLLALLRMIA